jgi:hypothetical protein
MLISKSVTSGEVIRRVGVCPHLGEDAVPLVPQQLGSVDYGPTIFAPHEILDNFFGVEFTATFTVKGWTIPLFTGPQRHVESVWDP